MFGSQRLDRLLRSGALADLGSLFTTFAEHQSTENRIAAVERGLREAGQEWRNEIGEWIAELLQVETLVPEAYLNWRPLVRECMSYFVAHFPDARLAPKIVGQIEAPADAPPEVRLSMLISKTPGLQKLGQVLARTRRLSGSLRQELQKLENGIHDVSAAEVREMVAAELGVSMEVYHVQLSSTLLSEASVGAILEFSWLNPATGKREEGVLKVIKPHIPACYAEDLSLLQRLAEHLVAMRKNDSASRHAVETLEEVRLLLEREVDFRREQATLAEVGRVYKRAGAHAPRPIPELSTDSITAMSVERGVKVTEAFWRRPKLARRVATRIVEALVADPILSSEEDAVFHADPHAGNLMYDDGKDELIVLDWALTGRLGREDRRQLARLMIMMTFRDAPGVRAAIHALSRDANGSAEIIDRCVDQFFGSLPHVCSLGAMDAMRLLDEIGLQGAHFPASLVLMRKSLFTLAGVLHDVAGEEVRLDSVVAREFMGRWLGQAGVPPGPFQLADLFAVERSLLWYASGLWSWAN